MIKWRHGLQNILTATVSSLPSMPSPLAMTSMALSIVAYLIAAALYFETKSVHKGVCQVKPTCFQDSSKSLAGYVHDLCSLALIQSFKINVLDGL
jgi:hypothetical protein